MRAGARSTITGNTAAASGQNGIDVFCASNLFDNTARGNTGTSLLMDTSIAACMTSNNLAP